MIDDTAPTAGPEPRNPIATRLLAEMQSSATAAAIRAFDGDLDRSIIFAVIARRSGALPAVAGHALSDDRPRAITINALATSLARPFETVRRHVNAMIDDELCERTPRGVVVPRDSLDRPPIAHQFETDHDLLVRLIEDMASFGMPLPRQRPVAYDPRIGIASALDVLLGSIEFSAAHYGSWLEMMILVAVGCANARPFVYDRDLSLAFSDVTRVPPEEWRAPVKIVGVARALGMPYSTVRRHAEAMLTNGALVRRRGGLLVSADWITRPALTVGNRTIAEHSRQILARLAPFGFPFDDPASAYIHGRPPLLSFAVADSGPEDGRQSHTIDGRIP